MKFARFFGNKLRQRIDMLVKLRYIAARHERAAGAANNHGAHVIILENGFRIGFQRQHQIVVHRVTDLRAVEGEGGDMVADIDE